MTARKQKASADTENLIVARQRLSILRSLENWLETPMIALSVVWLVLMVAELVWGASRFRENLAVGIWVLFIVDFVVRFTLAPGKLRFLRTNWLTVASLLLPALRMFRFARIFRALSRVRGLQLVRIIGSVNRGMKALGKTMQRRGFGYIASLTLIVTVAGAAGMLYFEQTLPNGDGLDNFWSALWWTAMLMTTMGSEYWPRTSEGRALCLFLSVYAFTVFGYVTGAIATYFIGRDAASDDADVLGKKELNALVTEIAALREEVRRQRNG